MITYLSRLYLTYNDVSRIIEGIVDVQAAAQGIAALR
jgi:hypothetical protein